MLHVLERCLQSKCLDEVLVATDHPRIEEVVRLAGGQVVLTSGQHRCGTDRVWEAAKERNFDVVVNIQGDQPRLDPRTVDACVKGLLESNVDMATVAGERVPPDAPKRVVRVVTDRQNLAVAFARTHLVDAGPNFHHIGIYAFRRAALQAFANRAPSPGELRESLEQLRVLEYGGRVKVVFVERATPSVDKPEDLEVVQAWNS